MIKKRWMLVLAALLLTLALCPTAIAQGLSSREEIQEWLGGKRVGLFIGSTLDEELKALIAQSEQVWLNTYADMSAALFADKIDAFLCEEPIAKLLCASTRGLYTPGVLLNEENYAFVLERGNTALAEQLNETICRLTASGELQKIREKWTTGDPGAVSMPDVQLTGENGVLRIATDAADAPFGYVVEGKMVGYDYELLTLFAQEHGYALEYAQTVWEALPAAIVSGKCDIACGCLSPTQVRGEKLLFSDVTFFSGLTIVTSDQYAPAGTNAPDEIGAWASVKASFERTFLREGRWKLIAQGLWTTVLISVLSALFGTLLGFGVCLARRGRRRVLQGAAKVFVEIMRGTPILVFLMILYYLVFGDVNPVLVAVIGFSLYFAAYVSEMMRAGLDAVDPGQIEAAGAIGFTRARAFLLITLPQAARHFLPVYKGEFISLVKMTSVVGYIAIQDLTKMSDIIRSRTYEAFFPLIATALIYFLLSWLLTLGLDALEIKIDPKRKKRDVRLER